MTRPFTILRPLLRSEALWAVAFCTGAAGLVYEVVWTRQLVRPLGSTALATGTVLGLFLAGLSLGSALAGRARLLRRRPLLLFGLAEAGTGLWALLLPFLVRQAGPLLLRLHPEEGSAPGLAALRIAIIGSLILPPALLMGATFPALVEAAARAGRRGAGREGGAVYAANTLGAGLGSGLAAFLLLPALGMRASTALAAAVDLCAAAVALAGRLPGGAAFCAPGSGAPGARAGAARPRRPRLPGGILLAVFLCGAGTLALEVVWTRLLGMILGTSVQALGTVLATFVLGLGGGAAIAASRPGWTARPGRARRTLALSLLLGTALTLAAQALVPLLPRLVSSLAARLTDTPRLLQLAEAGLCAALLLPAALLLGIAFPAGLRILVGRGGDAGGGAAVAYSASALGCLAGSLGAAVWAVPALGLRGALLAAAGAHAAGALAARLPAPRRWRAAARAALRRERPARRLGLLAAGVAAAAALLIVPWKAETIASGPFLYGPRITGEILFHRDGREATVTVARDGPWLSLRVNGKVDASTAADLETQRMLGHLGALLHPAPREVMVLGFASGITTGSVLAHPEVARVTAVEIEPAVIEGSAWFRAWNGGALGDQRLRLVVGDGRAHLARHPGAYDLVVSEPSNPWLAGLGDLFTREAFEAARRSLRPGGVFVQWVQGYGLTPDDLRGIVRTFAGVFPDATLWAMGPDVVDLALVGGPVRLDAAALRALLDAEGRAAGELRASGILRPADAAARLLAAGDGLRALAGEGPLLTDDHPWLEYTGPLHLRDTSLYGEMVRLLREHRSAPWEALRLDPETEAGARGLFASRGAVLEALDAVGHGAGERYEALLRRARELDPSDADAARLLARVQAELGLIRLEEGRTGAAIDLLEESARTDPLYPMPHLAMATLHEKRGEPVAAKLRYEAYLRLYPYDADAWERLARVREVLGDAEGARAARGFASSLRLPARRSR